MRGLVMLLLAGALTVAGCSSSAASTSATTATAAAMTTSAATVAPTAAAKSVVCDFYLGIEKEVADAAGQAMMGGNAAAATRQAINDIQALAAKATDPTEKQDLTTLADTMDSAVMAGGSFSDWDPAFEAFHAKYGPGCGQVVLTPAP